jgi:riboflavin kinase/FMN adenylyltransferase
MRIIYYSENLVLDKPTAAVLGYFDGVHKGHAAVIAAARQTGLEVTVVTFLQHPSEVLQNRSVAMLMNSALKEEAFVALGVDNLIYLDFAAFKDISAEDFIYDILIAKLRSKYVFCGFNYRFGKGGLASSKELLEICKKHGIEGICVEPVLIEGLAVSSTQIRKLVENGEMGKAALLLGRPFSLFLDVIHGRMLGRTFGTPTINQKLEEKQVRPHFGVYATTAFVGGKALPAVTNIGVKPTVGSKFVTAETYILDFTGDLYGEKVKIDLFRFLRDEIKFDNTEMLREQIFKDSMIAKSFFEGYASCPNMV